MRKQYHLREVDDGLAAWDVDRLIRLSAGLPVSLVAVADIPDLDTAYWSTGKTDPALTVREIVAHATLMRDVDLSYPVILAADGSVMDGMHRVARALLDGVASVPAVRFVQDPLPDCPSCDPAATLPSSDT
jgi:hypothetical protein